MKQLHPLPNRIFHWLMFFFIIVFIYTGAMIYWANSEYAIKFGTYTVFKLFPDSFFKFFKLDRKLALGMAMHFSLIFPYTIFCFSYLGYLLFSGGIRDYFKTSKSYKNSTTKFNWIQGLSYFGVICLLFACLISGFAIYKPSKMEWLSNLMGGYQAARLIHFISTIFLVLFIFVHIVQVIRAGWKVFFGIVIGDSGLPWSKSTPESIPEVVVDSNIEPLTENTNEQQ